MDRLPKGSEAMKCRLYKKSRDWLENGVKWKSRKE